MARGRRLAHQGQSTAKNRVPKPLLATQQQQVHLLALGVNQIQLLATHTSDSPKFLVTKAEATPEGTVITITTRERDPNVFPFLELPGEIRNCIYELVLGEERGENYDIRKATFTKPGAEQRQAKAQIAFCQYPQLLAINQKTREEALPLVFRDKKFVTINMPGLEWFLDVIGPVGRANIESFKIYWRPLEKWWTPRKSAKKLTTTNVCPLLYDCKRLRALEISFWKDKIDEVSLTSANQPFIDKFTRIPAVMALRALRGLKTLEVRVAYRTTPIRSDFTKWLFEAMSQPHEEEDLGYAMSLRKRPAAGGAESDNNAAKRRRVADSD